MKNPGLFETFWKKYNNKSLSARRTYFESLSKTEQTDLIHSLYKDGWMPLFVRNHINKILDYIKVLYQIDLIHLRIQAIKYNRVFLIDRSTWDYIRYLFEEFNSYYDSNTLFGGLTVSCWGKHKQFYRIRATNLNYWN